MRQSLGSFLLLRHINFIATLPLCCAQHNLSRTEAYLRDVNGFGSLLPALQTLNL